MGYFTSFHFFLVTMERLGSLVWVEKELMAVNLEFKMHTGSEKKWDLKGVSAHWNIFNSLSKTIVTYLIDRQATNFKTS